MESFPWQTMELADVQSLLQELTSTAYDMDTGQLEALVRACTIIEDMCSQKCREIIRRAQHRPCLQIVMSDGWSTDIRQRFRATSGSVDVQRTGRLRTEFIVQRTTVKSVLDSEVCMGMKIERPRPLAANKCSDICSAACDHVPLLKLAGQKNISIALYLQDGLMAAPFGKMMIADTTFSSNRIYALCLVTQQREIY